MLGKIRASRMNSKPGVMQEYSGKKKKIERKPSQKVGIVDLDSRDFWLNIVDFLQQYWAVIQENKMDSSVKVYFLNDSSVIFASLVFDTAEIAEKALMKNGFKRYDDPLENFTEFITLPQKPYHLINQDKRAKITS